jgi:hypothetical protein
VNLKAAVSKMTYNLDNEGPIEWVRGAQHVHQALMGVVIHDCEQARNLILPITVMLRSKLTKQRDDPCGVELTAVEAGVPYILSPLGQHRLPLGGSFCR